MRLSAIFTLAILFSFHWGAVKGEVETTREASIIDPAGSAKKEKIHEGVEPAESNGLRGKTYGSLAEVDGSMERNLGACPNTTGPVSWENYKWNKCLVDVIVDRVLSTTNWRNHFTTAVDNWNKASRIQVTKNNLAYTNSTAWTCSSSTGRIKVCNNNYGKTGWLGIAGIWTISGNLIRAGYIKVNDFYFSQAYYNTSNWRGKVMCQELGHNFGLGHWDTDFSTFCDSCMDYSSDPKPYPNQRDLDLLDNVIYKCARRLQGQSGSHRKNIPDSPGQDGKTFGKQIDHDVYSTTYALDYPNGTWITEVLWVDKKKVKDKF
jgi:hypothetical protein